jgi:hypothetical protein
MSAHSDRVCLSLLLIAGGLLVLFGAVLYDSKLPERQQRFSQYHWYVAVGEMVLGLTAAVVSTTILLTSASTRGAERPDHAELLASSSTGPPGETFRSGLA